MDTDNESSPNLSKKDCPGNGSVYPLAFSAQHPLTGAEIYLRDAATLKLLEFFESKGLPALKDEDRREQWYEDWLAFQNQHGLYAMVLSPQQYSNRGSSFDLLRYVRFLEVFAYFSPAHGYSLQVTFLGFFAILMGSNEALKREAVARLEAGNLLAFGVSEKGHGSDLMANEFRISQASAGHWIANGSKYYIGNANAASIIATLGHEAGGDAKPAEGRSGGRVPFILVALRPQRSPDTFTHRKIHTLGVRSAYVGAFDVTGYAIPDTDIIARGRQAWDAIFGTVTLGKFFLGFGSIGICEHALHEAVNHLRHRILYGKPAFDMPHLQSLMSQAYARLLAMKLYAYRTLDYVHAASMTVVTSFFCAVQKAKVSTEGVKVMALISECIGAKGFETDIYCEMAQRDAGLIPGLEGSMHINLGLAAQFLPRYFKRNACAMPDPPSLLEDAELASGHAAKSRENPYLMSARTGGTHAIEFAWFLNAYRGLTAIPNVALFVRQAAHFRRFLKQYEATRPDKSDLQISLALGQCLATIAYGQLVAENATHLKIPPSLVSIIFSLLVTDLSTAAMQLASIPAFSEHHRPLLKGMISVPATTVDQWASIADLFNSF